jgi:hypothetical protein
MKPTQGVCSVACETARRHATGVYTRMQAARTRRTMAPLALADFGALTEREQGIYLRGRENALVYARDKARRIHEAWTRAARTA